jgi:putative intracellular protease/amidase
VTGEPGGAHATLAQTTAPDILIIPGGQGTRREMHNPVVLDWVRRTARGAELILSVCTGSLVLASAGLLDGLQATTHHGAIELLRETAPSCEGAVPGLEGQVSKDPRIDCAACGGAAAGPGGRRTYYWDHRPVSPSEARPDMALRPVRRGLRKDHTVTGAA